MESQRERTENEPWWGLWEHTQPGHSNQASHANKSRQWCYHSNEAGMQGGISDGRQHGHYVPLKYLHDSSKRRVCMCWAVNCICFQYVSFYSNQNKWEMKIPEKGTKKFKGIWVYMGILKRFCKSVRSNKPLRFRKLAHYLLNWFSMYCMWYSHTVYCKCELWSYYWNRYFRLRNCLSGIDGINVSNVFILKWTFCVWQCV